MKKILYACLMIGTLISCQKNGEKEDTSVNIDEMQLFEYDDSTKQAIVDLHVTLPTATDSASTQVRDSLLELLYRYVSTPGVIDGTPRMERFSGKGNDYQAIINYYGKSLLDSYTAEAENEYKEMETDPEWESPIWGTTVNIAPTADSLCYGLKDSVKFIVFDANAFCYLGGAHGSYITDSYCFRRSDGAHFTQFFADSVTLAMQPLLRKGVFEYVKGNDESVAEEALNDYLSLPDDSGIIPLPITSPCPTRQGLLFTYQQYEICCYAMGMPSFILSYEELMPYLSEEAKEILF